LSKGNAPGPPSRFSATIVGARQNSKTEQFLPLGKDRSQQGDLLVERLHIAPDRAKIQLQCLHTLEQRRRLIDRGFVAQFFVDRHGNHGRHHLRTERS
jgi:hypothetical protein